MGLTTVQLYCAACDHPEWSPGRQRTRSTFSIEVTDGTSRRVESGRYYTSLILVDIGHEVSQAYYRNLMLLQQFLSAMSDLGRVHLEAGQCAGAHSA